MAIKAKYEMKGARELDETLSKLPFIVRDKVAGRALRQGAIIIRDIAIGNAPKGDRKTGKISGVNITSGNLKRSIYVRRVKEPAAPLSVEYEILVRSPGRVNAKQRASGQVGAYYWRYVEFGTSRMPKRAFMREALITGKSEAEDKVKTALGEGIEIAAAKLGAAE